MKFGNAVRGGRVLRCLAVAGLVAGAATAGTFGLPGKAVAAEHWASAADAKIHPGTSLNSEAGQCTANFIFTNGDKVYIGAAAHCVGKGGPNDTDGCKAGSYPIGFEVTIDGASHPGKLAYSSWLAMQKGGDKNDDLCQYNDFALIQIDDEDIDKTNPSVPKFGGPNGLRKDGLPAGDKIYTFGNSELRAGISLLSPKTGVNLGDAGGGRTHSVTTVSPGIPGDSGSGYLDSSGRAFGVLSTLSLTPIPGANGVSDLNKAIEYAKDNVDDLDDLELVNGTESFKPGLGLGIL